MWSRSPPVRAGGCAGSPRKSGCPAVLRRRAPCAADDRRTSDRCRRQRRAAYPGRPRATARNRASDRLRPASHLQSSERNRTWSFPPSRPLRFSPAEDGEVEIAPVATHVGEARLGKPGRLVLDRSGEVLLDVFAKPGVVVLAVGLDEFMPPLLVA